jgi:hypothetical protein
LFPGKESASIQGMDYFCEIKSFGCWEQIPLEQALGMPKDRLMRCPECHGRVRAHSTGKNGEAAHFEHHERNPGCSLGHYFDGTKKLHRKVIE